MLPKIDANGGRGATRADILQSRSGPEAGAVQLPRLRLLKQHVEPDGSAPAWPPAALQPIPQVAAPPLAPLPPQRRRQRSRGDSDERQDNSVPPGRRGRGLLRPIALDGESHHEPRSPPVLPNKGIDRSEAHIEDNEVEDACAVLQQQARERVKGRRRQARRAAREEEERRHQDEQERLERVQKAQGMVEAYRRDLAKQAAERARVDRLDREDKVLEREELQSARRERMWRYKTPAQVRELIKLEQIHHSRPSASGGSGSSKGARDHSLDEVCNKCGNDFLPDAAFCRKCGEKRQGGSKSSVEPRKDGSPHTRGDHHRQGRAPTVEVRGSRDRERRRRNGGRSRAGMRERRTSRDHPEHHEHPVEQANVGGQSDLGDNAPERKSGGEEPASQQSYYSQHISKAILDRTGWENIYAQFHTQGGSRTEASIPQPSETSHKAEASESQSPAAETQAPSEKAVPLEQATVEAQPADVAPVEAASDAAKDGAVDGSGESTASAQAEGETKATEPAVAASEDAVPAEAAHASSEVQKESVPGEAPAISVEVQKEADAKPDAEAPSNDAEAVQKVEEAAIAADATAT